MRCSAPHLQPAGLPANIYASARTAVDGTPLNITTAGDGKAKLEKPENIIGIQAQLWGETLRSFDEVQYLFQSTRGRTNKQGVCNLLFLLRRKRARG